MEVAEPRSDDEDQLTGNGPVPALNSSHADNAVATEATFASAVVDTEATFKPPVLSIELTVNKEGNTTVAWNYTDMCQYQCPICQYGLLQCQRIAFVDCGFAHRVHFECLERMQNTPPNRGERLKCPVGGCASHNTSYPHLTVYHEPGECTKPLKGPKDWKQEPEAKARSEATAAANAAAGASRQRRSNDMPAAPSPAPAVASDLLDLDAEDAAGPQADAEDRPPAGEGGLKRKRKKASGAQRAKKKAGKKAEEEDGGFTDKGRVAFKAEGGVLVTGGKRTCLPDALYMLLLSLSIPVDVEEVRTIMPADPSENTLFMAADNFVSQFGLTLQRVTSRFMSAKGGVALALLQASGYFVVQLRITAGKDDKDPDLHCVAYDGATVRDNYQWSKVKDLDEGDRASPASARKVFNSLFHRDLEVRIKNVYELMPL